VIDFVSDFDLNHAANFSDKICCDLMEARLVAPSFSRLFWGEQPPFTPIGRGGR
jgi:hypothetical protein